MIERALDNPGRDWEPQNHEVQAALPDAREATSAIDEILIGLSGRQKKLPSKLFYDERGSKLFDEICKLGEYYVTRTETALMEKYAVEMASELGTGTMLIEYGSGSSTKTRVLLSNLDRPAGYVPIDISSQHLANTARGLERIANCSPIPEVETTSCSLGKRDCN